MNVSVQFEDIESKLQQLKAVVRAAQWETLAIEEEARAIQQANMELDQFIQHSKQVLWRVETEEQTIAQSGAWGQTVHEKPMEQDLQSESLQIDELNLERLDGYVTSKMGFLIQQVAQEAENDVYENPKTLVIEGDASVIAQSELDLNLPGRESLLKEIEQSRQQQQSKLNPSQFSWGPTPRLIPVRVSPARVRNARTSAVVQCAPSFSEGKEPMNQVPEPPKTEVEVTLTLSERRKRIIQNLESMLMSQNG